MNFFIRAIISDMLIIRKVYLFVFLLLLLSLISCNVSQEVFINGSGQGKIVTDVTLKPVLLETLGDLMMLSSPVERTDNFDELLVDTDNLAVHLTMKEGIDLAVVNHESRGRWVSEIKFSDLNKLFSSSDELTSAQLIELQNRADGSIKITGKINRSNFDNLAQFFPILDNPDFAPFHPLKNGVVNYSEYRENVDFALDQKGVKALNTSFLMLGFKTEGKITECAGGELTGQNSALVKIPLIDILVLNREITFSLTFYP